MMEGEKTPWISLRHEYPLAPGWYAVKDCRYDIPGTAFYEGKALYDGWDWRELKLTKPIKGNMLMIDNIVTHWRRLEDWE